MLALSQLNRDVLRTLREHLRPLIAYHLFFTLLASLLLLPAVAWTLTHLLARFGRTVITNAELVDILMSAGGALWLLAAVGLTFLVLYLQQAGMILVAARPRDNHLRLAFEALWWTLRDRKSTRLNSSHVRISYAVVVSKTENNASSTKR